MANIIGGCLLLFGLFVSCLALSDNQKENIDRTVRSLMKCANISSLSLTLVKPDSRIVYSKGFGRPYAQSSTSTRSDSTFCIGGITQTFTSVLLAKLIDENENVTWDTSIEDILGRRLGMPDRYISDHLNLKDILSMRSGLAGMDFVPVVKAFKNREELVKSLRFVQSVAGYREKYVRNEVLFAYVEDVVQALTLAATGTKENWSDSIKRYLLEPLGMTNTVFIGESGLPNSLNLARGTITYLNNAFELPLEAYSGLQLIAPAASICTSADDMAKWLTFLLAGGRSERSEIIKKQALETTYKALVPRDNPGDVATEGLRDSSFLSSPYTRDQNAVGWIKGYYKGKSVISQDGTLASYQSLLSIILPERVAVYTAFTGDEDKRSLVAKILLNVVGLDFLIDGNLDLKHRDICTLFTNIVNTTQDVTSKRFRNIQRESSTNEKFDQYAADYRSYAFGDISVRFNESSEVVFSLTYGGAVYKLEKTNVNDTFQLLGTGHTYWYTTNSDYNRKKPVYATFKLDPENRNKSVIITGFDKDLDAEFSTKPTVPNADSYYYESVCAGSSSTISSIWFTSLAALLYYVR